MNLDVSPDGKKIAFDLLGDVYVVDIAGGLAEPVTGGRAWDKRPVWSPDGSKLAFISDRSGSDQVYVVNARSFGESEPVRVTHGDAGRYTVEQERKVVEWLRGAERLFVDGQIIDIATGEGYGIGTLTGVGGGAAHSSVAATYYFAVDQKLPAGEQFAIGSYAPSGSLWKLAPDGRNVARQPEAFPFLAVYDAPVVSGDGRWVVFKDAVPADDVEAPLTIPSPIDTRVDVLRVYDRKAKAVRTLLGPGISSGWRSNSGRSQPAEGMRFAMTPDSKFAIVPYAGEIHRVAVENGEDTVIPFTVNVRQCLLPLVRNKVRISQEAISVKAMRSVGISSDNKMLAFSALRQLYVQKRIGGVPRLLTKQDEGQFDPSFSPDGKWIAYVTRGDDNQGHVWRVRRGGGAPELLVKARGAYRYPAWSPEGDSLAFSVSDSKFAGESEPNIGHLAYLPIGRQLRREVIALPVKVDTNQPVSFDWSGKRIVYSALKNDGWRGRQVRSVGLGGDDRHHTLFDKFLPNTRRLSVTSSPGLDAAAIIKYGNLYVISCEQRQPCIEVQVTREGATDPKWLHGGKVLEWSFAGTYYQAPLVSLLSGNDGAGDGDKADSWRIRALPLLTRREWGAGTVVLKGGKVITMESDLVIENGAVVVKDGHITDVGRVEDVNVPHGAHVVDVTGKIIMPGLVDAHAHLTTLPDGVMARDYWEMLAYLAFGVTTVRDPSFQGDHAFGYAELVESGRSVGPRMYGTVALVNGDFNIDSFEDAKHLAARYKKLGATFMKYHTGWDRQQRQWIINASRELGLNAVSHAPAINYFSGALDLSTIVDGTTTSEHVFGLGWDMHEDALRFLVQSKVDLDFASISSYGGYAPVLLDRAKHEDLRMRRFHLEPTPNVLSRISATERDERAPPELVPESYANAKFMADLAREGAHVMIGSHGDNDGIGMHWEMWAHASAGMPNLEVLRAATLGSAHGLGASDDIGSVSVGKVADLLVLDADPLSNIKNTTSVSMVMKAGVIRDADTLDEIWPNRKPGPLWLSQQSRSDKSEADPLH